MKKSTKIFTGAVIGGVVTAIAAPFLLPALGAAGLLGVMGIGTAITSASRAVVTGTVAGTFAVVAAAGAVIGGVVIAAYCSKKEDK